MRYAAYRPSPADLAAERLQLYEALTDEGQARIDCIASALESQMRQLPNYRGGFGHIMAIELALALMQYGLVEI